MKTSKKNIILHSIVDTLANNEEICFSFNQYNKEMLLCMHKQDNQYWAELSTETSPIRKAFVSGETYDKLIAYLNKRLTMQTANALVFDKIHNSVYTANKDTEETFEICEELPF